MNTRLKQFLAAENITQAQFADTIQVVRASVSHVLSGRNNPSYDFIKAIMLKYPQLNMEWLMFGRGKMYKEKQNGTGLLFDDTSESELTDDFSFIEDTSLPAAKPITESETLVKPVQNFVNQRKISKIIVFFDDGSYQEIH